MILKRARGCGVGLSALFSLARGCGVEWGAGAGWGWGWGEKGAQWGEEEVGGGVKEHA